MKTLELSTPVKLNKVLFATDFSAPSNAALPYALAIAHEYGAKFYAAHVNSAESYLLATPESFPSLKDAGGDQILDAARVEKELRKRAHTVVGAVGDISDVLFRMLKDNDIDLLVLGTHGRSGLSKLLMGSVAEQIFRRASCPVLTVGPHVPHTGKPIADLHRIVFATDFSDESLAAASYAISLAKEHMAHLFFLHVLDQKQSSAVDYQSNADFVIRRMRDLVPQDSELWFRSNYAVEFGDAEEEILKYAKAHDADLIVLGVRAPVSSLNTLAHLAHSRSHGIVSHATCPVLTVRG
jgi:nucleotide-binding universal stress UspA family protein